MGSANTYLKTSWDGKNYGLTKEEQAYNSSIEFYNGVPVRIMRFLQRILLNS